MCKCLEIVNEKIKEDLQDEEAELQTTLSPENGRFVEYPRLSICYRPKKRDGTHGKPKMMWMRPSFCPFCGEKYPEAFSK
jgi:hypothetical protein